MKLINEKGMLTLTEQTRHSETHALYLQGSSVETVIQASDYVRLGLKSGSAYSVLESAIRSPVT